MKNPNTTRAGTDALAIEGPLSVESAARWRGEIESCIKHSPTPELSLRCVETMDTIGVQLVVAASKMARARGLSLELTELSPAAQTAFAAAGVDPHSLRICNPSSQ